MQAATVERTDGRREDDGQTEGGRIPRGPTLARSKCLKRPNKRNEKVEKRPRKRGDISAAAATTIKRKKKKKKKKKKCNNARRTGAE